jgi:hypothetical protein
MQAELAETKAGCCTLKLTVTRRCPKAVVNVAKRYVSDFEAHESNMVGEVSYVKRGDDGCYPSNVADNDMVLCRTNAPLVSECLSFIASNRKATIRGRDVGDNLVSLVEKLCGVDSRDDVTTLFQKLVTWHSSQVDKENAKKVPSESAIQLMQDKVDCIMAIASSKQYVNEVVSTIRSIFDDKQNFGIRLSSIHKAKGLESRNVYILLVPCGSNRERRDWELQQEDNLDYVACTRAQERLTYVMMPKKS